MSAPPLELAEDFRGLLIDGPNAVPLSDATLPLSGGYGVSGVELAIGGPTTRAVLVGGSLETGQVRARVAVERDGMASPKQSPIAPAQRLDPATSFAVGTFDLDARARLDLPWEAGTWTFRLLLRGQASEPVRVKLEGPPARPPALALPSKGPAYRWRDVEDAPPVPGRAGIALWADRALVPTEKDARWRVRLSWRLPVRAHERVPEPAEGAPRFVDPEAKAVVPITLVIVGTVMPGPWRVRLHVPCYDLAGDQGTGQVEVDLLKVGAPTDAQTFFIYAAAGEVLSGPALTALVSPDALPRDRRSS